ncbi:DUF29 domain-containing protein [Methylobacterium sp. sgz302541]|uniref:DUF29 domain-containing protein n=1 Tax=unclassified Methylobacterium TaxID=2615210 RepID=UPI003D34DF3E
MAEPVPKGAPHSPASRASVGTAYEADLYTWVQEQVALLRAGAVDALDLQNIAEELSDVGSEQYDKLESAVDVLVAHMLKWDNQPERRSRSWTITIAEQRKRIEKQLRKNPGLKPRIAEAIEDGYDLGRLRAAREMRCAPDLLPRACPYTWDEIVNRPFELDADR